MSTIITELDKRIKENSDRLLYAFLDLKGEVKESHTYSEFDARVKSISSYLQNNFDFTVGDRILLAYPPGLEIICSFFACVRVGLIPVPVYPPSANGFESSLQKMQFIANDCDSSVILSTRAYQLSAQINVARIGGEHAIDKSYHKLNWIATDDISTKSDAVFTEKHSEILFLQYTSGSTNNPKGVIITHQNLLDNCENVVDHTPIGVSWLPQYHDMGLIGYYLFFALKGGTTYGFSPTDFILKPSLWLETISKYKATATSAPNFAFDYCLQEGKISDETLANLDLRSLKFVMNAAEPVKSTTYTNFIQKFKHYGLDPEASFIAYGLAENTLAVTNYGKVSKTFDSDQLRAGKAIETDSKNSVSIMSCGKTLGDTKVKIVNTDSIPKEAINGTVGEIWVTGSSKGRGYWNRPTLSKETFSAQLEDDNRLWLRTGDLGFVLEDDLYVCGRSKDMIIIRGLNYYPQDIESIIEEDEQVRRGNVAVFTIEQGTESELVAVIGIKNKRRIPEMERINSRILNYFGIHVHKAIFVLARDVSKTSSGKIRRGQNKRIYKADEFTIIDSFESKERTGIEAKEELSDHQSSNSLEKLFHKYNLLQTETATLGDAGLDSMRLAEFAHDLKQLLIQFKFEDLADEIDLRIIQKIAVSELFEIVFDLSTSNRFARFRFKKSFAAIQNEYREVEMNLMRRDSPSILESIDSLKMIDPMNQNGSILVTGGTGFFGPFIIKSLLEQQEDSIYVLVRAKDEETGFKRLKEAFEKMDCGESLLESFERRVRAVPGDLEKFKLGMDSATWTEMSQRIHTIYHNGALVNYLLDYESMRGSNVNGTNEVIRLATSERLKTLNYVSTTFIFGWSTKDVLYETDVNKEMQSLDFGYSQSKWVSERVVEHAMQNGLPGRIFRPALIAPSIDGFGYNFDIAIRLLAFMVKYGIGTTAKNQVSFTPADVAANNIVAIATIEDSLNKTFHVTRDEFSSMQDVTTILSKIAGKDFHHFGLKEFVPEVISKCKKEDLLFPLLNFLVRSVDNISSMEFKRYDNSNYVKYRRLSPWGKEDDSLEDVVGGIYKFMKKNEIITKNQ